MGPLPAFKQVLAVFGVAHISPSLRLEITMAIKSSAMDTLFIILGNL